MAVVVALICVSLVTTVTVDGIVVANVTLVLFVTVVVSLFVCDTTDVVFATVVEILSFFATAVLLSDVMFVIIGPVMDILFSVVDAVAVEVVVLTTTLAPAFVFKLGIAVAKLFFVEIVATDIVVAFVRMLALLKVVNIGSTVLVVAFRV